MLSIPAGANCCVSGCEGPEVNAKATLPDNSVRKQNKSVIEIFRLCLLKNDTILILFIILILGIDEACSWADQSLRRGCQNNYPVLKLLNEDLLMSLGPKQ